MSRPPRTGSERWGLAGGVSFGVSLLGPVGTVIAVFWGPEGEWAPLFYVFYGLVWMVAWWLVGIGCFVTMAFVDRSQRRRGAPRTVW